MGSAKNEGPRGDPGPRSPDPTGPNHPIQPNALPPALSSPLFSPLNFPPLQANSLEPSDSVGAPGYRVRPRRAVSPGWSTAAFLDASSRARAETLSMFGGIGQKNTRASSGVVSRGAPSSQSETAGSPCTGPRRGTDLLPHGRRRQLAFPGLASLSPRLQSPPARQPPSPRRFSRRASLSSSE